MTDLLPCPFCGGEPRWAKSDSGSFTQVVCNSCGGRGNEHPDQEKAAWYWNRRAAPLMPVYSSKPLD